MRCPLLPFLLSTNIEFLVKQQLNYCNLNFYSKLKLKLVYLVMLDCKVQNLLHKLFFSHTTGQFNLLALWDLLSHLWVKSLNRWYVVVIPSTHQLVGGDWLGICSTAHSSVNHVTQNCVFENIESKNTIVILQLSLMFPKLQQEVLSMRLVNGEIKQLSQRNGLQPVMVMDRRGWKVRHRDE